jgi:hypothetical protein
MSFTIKDFGAALRNGPYAWPGGYPLYFVTADGGALSFATAWEERSNIAEAINKSDNTGGWRVVGMDVNWEDTELYDDHTSERIESAYEEDDAEGEPAKIPESYKKWRERSRQGLSELREPSEFFQVGRNVQLHPATDRWMMGDKFGQITKVEPDKVRVRLDVSQKSLWFKRDDILNPENRNP